MSSENQKKFNPTEHPAYLIKVVQQEIRKKMDEELNQLELTTPQYATLSVLEDFPESSNADLARRCFVTPQTMNLIVRNLESRGLIERSASKEHGRIQNIVLTKAARKLLKRANATVERIEREIFAPIAEEELRLLTRILNKVRP